MLTTELDPMERRDLGHCHSVKVYRTDLIDIVQLHKLWWPENAHGA